MTRPRTKFARRSATGDGRPVLCRRPRCRTLIATLVEVAKSDSFPHGVMVAPRYGFPGYRRGLDGPAELKVTVAKCRTCGLVHFLDTTSGTVLFVEEPPR